MSKCSSSFLRMDECLMHVLFTYIFIYYGYLLHKQNSANTVKNNYRSLFLMTKQQIGSKNKIGCVHNEKNPLKNVSI